MITSRRFEGKVCLVTASSTGIGLAICERFAREGATVIINSRSEKNVKEAVDRITKQGGKADGVVCHAGKVEDIKKLLNYVMEKYGRLDVLVPNAAVSTHVGQTLDMTAQQFDKMFEVNFKGAFLLIKESYELLKKTKDSNIVIISSYGGYELEIGLGIYSVTKTALIALSKLLSKELKEDNIRVNCVAPGIIKTKFSSLLWEGKEKETIDSLRLNRLGEVEDVGNLVAFLSSHEGSYINGETVVVAGKPSSRL